MPCNARISLSVYSDNCFNVVIPSFSIALRAGADINARDASGATALHGAAGQGWNTVLGLLARRGADLFAKDGRGRMAIELTRGEAATSGRAAGSPARPETEALLRELMAAASPPGP